MVETISAEMLHNGAKILWTQAVIAKIMQMLKRTITPLKCSLWKKTQGLHGDCVWLQVGVHG